MAEASSTSRAPLSERAYLRAQQINRVEERTLASKIHTFDRIWSMEQDVLTSRINHYRDSYRDKKARLKIFRKYKTSALLKKIQGPSLESGLKKVVQEEVANELSAKDPGPQRQKKLERIIQRCRADMDASIMKCLSLDLTIPEPDLTSSRFPLIVSDSVRNRLKPANFVQLPYLMLNPSLEAKWAADALIDQPIDVQDKDFSDNVRKAYNLEIRESTFPGVKKKKKKKISLAKETPT